MFIFYYFLHFGIAELTGRIGCGQITKGKMAFLCIRELFEKV